MAVDDAVIERAGEVHPLGDLDPERPFGAVTHWPGPLLDLVHAEDGDLGMLHHRSSHQASILAERSDGEGRALQLVQLQLVLPSGLGQAFDLGAELPDRLVRHVPDHEDREAGVGGGAEAEIHLALDDERLLLLVHQGIEIGKFVKAAEERPGDEGQVAELRLALARELRIDLRAQRSERAGIAFLDEGERHHIGVALRHGAGDALAQPAKRPHFVGLGRAGRGRRRLRRPLLPELRLGQHVRLHHPALRPAALQLREIDSHLARHPPRHRRGEQAAVVAVPAFGARGWCARALQRRRLSGVLRRQRRRSLRRGRSAVHLEHDQCLVDLGDLAFLAHGLDHLAAARAGDGDGGLVGHHLDERLVLGDLVARLDQPFDDLALDHAFADVGQPEFELGHVRPRSLSARGACARCAARAAGNHFPEHREMGCPSR